MYYLAICGAGALGRKQSHARARTAGACTATRARTRSPASEAEFGRELNAPGPAPTQKRISDPNVPGSAQREVACPYFTVSRDLKSVEARIRDKSRQERIGEIGVVQQVEELGSKLKIQALGDRGGLEEGEVG